MIHIQADMMMREFPGELKLMDVKCFVYTENFGDKL